MSLCQSADLHVIDVLLVLDPAFVATSVNDGAVDGLGKFLLVLDHETLSGAGGVFNLIEKINLKDSILVSARLID